MSDPLQATTPPFAAGHAVDRTKLDQTILRPSPDVQGTSMEGETVLLDLSIGRYYTLNRIGSVIWEHCTNDKTLSDIHAVLCNRFDVAPERALDDLVALVNQLVQEGLLQQERRWEK
jgi:Coenzyme PQQ synthesis protein D (PqqD)